MVKERPHSSPRTPEPFSSHPTNPTIDLSFLQDRNLYHPLTTEDIPEAFLRSNFRPSQDTSLADLLQYGHFRLAAETAVEDLLKCPPDAAEQIFQLLYTRLACLVLVSRPDVAAQEASPLLDLLSRNLPEVQHIVPVIPWDLRLLLVRLQPVGAGDGGRRGIMALYSLGNEVRANLQQARDNSDQRAVDLWSQRLRSLGLRVCDALVEMGELETATRHLDSLMNVDADELAYRRALMRMTVGDVTGARRSAHELTNEARKKAFQALLRIADGDFPESLESWQLLMKDDPSHELFAQNAAVSLIYTGHVNAVRDALEDISNKFPLFPGLLFNLATVYELCTDNAKEPKMGVAVKAANKTPGPQSGGWERANFEFKL